MRLLLLILALLFFFFRPSKKVTLCSCRSGGIFVLGWFIFSRLLTRHFDGVLTPLLLYRLKAIIELKLKNKYFRDLFL